MASEIDICNKALGHLGAASIASLKENTSQAIALSRVYDMVRDAVLRDHPWGFATVITTLSRVSGETVPGAAYLHAYPSNCLFIRKVFDDPSTMNPDGREFMEVVSPSSGQKAIASDVEVAYVEYTKKITDASFYDAMFVEALAYRLAAEIAYPIKGDNSLRPELLNLYSFALGEARRRNRQERKVDEKRESSFEGSRG